MMQVTVAGIELDNNFYDRAADVPYLHVGDPGSAVRFDATPEGHHTRYGANGNLVGVTIVNARRLLEQEGEIALTLPQHRVVARDLGSMVAA